MTSLLHFGSHLLVPVHVDLLGLVTILLVLESSRRKHLAELTVLIVESRPGRGGELGCESAQSDPALFAAVGMGLVDEFPEDGDVGPLEGRLVLPDSVLVTDTRDVWHRQVLEHVGVASVS